MATPHMKSKAYARISPKPSRGSGVHSKGQYSIIKVIPYTGVQPKWTMPLSDAVRLVEGTHQEMYQLCEVQT